MRGWKEKVSVLLVLCARKPIWEISGSPNTGILAIGQAYFDPFDLNIIAAALSACRMMIALLKCIYCCCFEVLYETNNAIPIDVRISPTMT